MKIAFISRHPAPYRDPLMARLNSAMVGEIEFFNELPFDDGHGFWDLKEHGYSASDLYPNGLGRIGRLAHLLKKFVFGQYDFVLWSGFIAAEMTVAMFVSAVLGKRYGFAADTAKQAPLRGLRKFIKKTIVRRASLIFVPGEAGARFWTETYGVPKERIMLGAYALDGAKIAASIDALRNERAKIRAAYGIASDDTVYLMVANMIPSRHYPVTTEAFSRFAQGRKDMKFVIVGRGPDYPQMKAYASAHPEIVPIDGVSFDKMLSLYAMADVYVHGGTEPASTALVIGAIAGLPLISSKAVGCAFDVLRDGESGVEVRDYLSVADWTKAFERMQSMREDWDRLGARGVELAEALDVGKTASAFMAYMRSFACALEGGK